MDFQKLVDAMAAMTCVVSVEILDDNSKGDFRIVTGNRAYMDSIEKPAPGAEMLVKKFVPDSLYTDYLTRDLNFEEYCYRSAVDKKSLHSYVTTERLKGIWLNMTFLPIAYEEKTDKGRKCYCTYTMEMEFQASTENLSSLSNDVATKVVETCLLLRNNNDFKDAMTQVINGIRDMCEAEHCCIFLVDTYERKCSVLCEAFGQGTKLKPMGVYVDDKFYEIAESWPGLIGGSNCLIAKDEEDMQIVKGRNPVWYKSISDAGGKNIVLFPLKANGELLGYIWAINFNKDNALKIKKVLETTSIVIGSEISGYHMLNRLKILSSRDMLTGVLNRNEMNNYIDKMVVKEKTPDSLGIIFADLNGLKKINDEYGHARGDALLKDAAKALREIFKSEEIYRAGGDEFTVILRGVGEKELYEKADKIKEVASKYKDLSFAVGACYTDETKNITETLRCADERMYEDKKAYYSMNPDKQAR